ncbi:putative ATP-dependent DNA helicase RecQ, partial [Vibrio sp. AND4]
EKCGHCSVCRGQVASFPQPQQAQPELAHLSTWIDEFVQLSPTVISDAAVARFLCGVSTPIITQLKASKLQGYGSMANVSFKKVLEQVESARV